jgi:Ras association domain-containing protein 2/4
MELLYPIIECKVNGLACVFQHKGVPYCHVPCYGALFGPQLFGHGTRVESHTSFGKVENRTGCSNLPRSHLESKLKVFNQYYDGRSGEIRSREVMHIVYVFIVS